MGKLRLHLIFLKLILLCVCFPGIQQAQPLSREQIDALADRSLRTFDVPGMAVCILKDGKVIHSKGYGVRSLNNRQPVDPQTLFGVASNTKAFTAAALGLLQQEGRLSYDDPVIKFIPEFRMYDPYVTSAFTIRDLLTHRSGLGLGAGDLTIFPDGNDFTVPDVVRAMWHLRPVSSFRTKYDYDNLLYIIAGEVIARVSGQKFEEFIEQRIMTPLGMNSSAADFHRVQDTSNIADAHAPVDNKMQAIDRYDLSLTAAAGGIYTNIEDLGKWVMMLLGNGKYAGGKKTLLSEALINNLWSPQTIVPVGRPDEFNTHFAAYGLGWFLSDVNGKKKVTHTGGLPGMVTQVTLVPELNLGIIVLTNQQSGSAFRSVSNTILQGYLGTPKKDWISHYHTMDIAAKKEADSILDAVQKEIKRAAGAREGVDPAQFAGTYSDKWFGDVVLSVNSGTLHFRSARSPKLSGTMHYYKGNTFVVRWFDRSMDADAFMTFSLGHDGRPASAEMKAISPLTDFSYDFHDLDLRRLVR